MHIVHIIISFIMYSALFISHYNFTKYCCNPNWLVVLKTIKIYQERIIDFLSLVRYVFVQREESNAFDHRVVSRVSFSLSCNCVFIN